MLRTLLATTAVIAISAPAAAETISTAVATPVRTSTVKAGTPDAITIATTGSVKPTTGTAVTMDSNHGVTNQGAIAVTNADGAIGVLALNGTTGDVTNSGTITIDETYAATDTNNDGDLDGPFALGRDRAGIRLDGTHTGKLVHGGTITVKGNSSFGIVAAGPLTGSFAHDGTTTVLGDGSTAVQVNAVSGDVRLAGIVTATGQGAVAARLGGDVAGALVVQGSVGATGYRYTTPPTNAPSLDDDDLLQGGSALLVQGSVAKGIVLAVAPKDASTTDNDEDKDGIEDAKEGNAAVSAFGAAPAFVIGTGRDIAIGAVAGTASGHGLIIDGTVNGNGVYAGVDGNGLVIGGRGGAVSIAGGITVGGAVSASSNGATATALRLGDKASVPELRVAGTVAATGKIAYGVEVGAGASLTALRITGTVKAEGKAGGAATAILAAGNSLPLIENAGTVVASGGDTGRNVAIDFTANTAGATVRQTVVTTATAPSITGDVRFGSGKDLFDVADGTVKGDIAFGAGANRMQLSGDAVHTGKATFGADADVLSLAGTSVFDGTADFGGGSDTLVLANSARFTGGLANADGLAVQVNGGTLAVNRPATIASLAVASGGTIAATLDKDAGEGTLLTVAGNASFAANSNLALTLSDTANAEGRYTVLQAGSITGAANLATKADTLPFLFKAAVATNVAPNTIAIDVTRRTVTELGLNRSGAAAYNAVFAAIGTDDPVEDLFLAIRNGEEFRAAADLMLPDHAGGVFEGVSLGTRAFARQQADPQSPVYSIGGLDVLMSAAAWDSGKDAGQTQAYDLSGFGFSLGGEVDSKAGAFGLSLAWYWNQHDQGGDVNRVQSDTYELAGYWRGKWGGLATHARASIGRVMLSGRRTLSATVGGKPLERNAETDWHGTLVTAIGGISYEFGGGGLFLRPSVTADYVRLNESGHTSTGGGKALDLTVEARSSDEFAVNGGLTVGINFTGRRRTDANWFRIEGEGGWREIVGGALGDTVAKFGNGTAFTLTPEQSASGWYARARAIGGTQMFEVGGEVGAEERHDRTALTLRGTLRVGF